MYMEQENMLANVVILKTMCAFGCSKKNFTCILAGINIVSTDIAMRAVRLGGAILAAGQLQIYPKYSPFATASFLHLKDWGLGLLKMIAVGSLLETHFPELSRPTF